MAFQKEQKCLQGSTDGEIFHSVLLRGNNLKKKGPHGKQNDTIIPELHSVVYNLVLCCLLKGEKGFYK